MHDIRFDSRQSRRVRPRAGAARAAAAGEAADRARRARRATIQEAEAAQARRNAASKEIGEAKKSKDEATAQALMAEVAALKDAIPRWKRRRRRRPRSSTRRSREIPNLPLDEVPDGKDENDNVEHHHFGAKRDYAFAPKQHFELGEALGQMDFETAAKLRARALSC